MISFLQLIRVEFLLHFIRLGMYHSIASYSMLYPLSKNISDIYVFLHIRQLKHGDFILQ
jgi:hypothetical protein